MPFSNKEKINLCEIVEHIIAFYDAVDIKYAKTVDDAIVLVDQNQMIRVLNNVLNNAIEAINDDHEPEIILSLELIEDSVLLTIKDNGRGIPAVLHDKIFQPNFTTKNSGMGLGLAMVKRIIDDVGGNIYFESQQNKGTTFYISVPLLKQKG